MQPCASRSMRGTAVRVAQVVLHRSPRPKPSALPYRALVTAPARTPRRTSKSSIRATPGTPNQTSSAKITEPQLATDLPTSASELPAGALSEGDAPEGSGQDSKVTPAIAQYLKLKSAHPGFLLLFQMGEFYEAFFEDAVRAAELLGIALTRRDDALWLTIVDSGKPPIPMAGVPIHNLDHYLEKLIKRGVMVAICDQLEDAKEAKKRRDVIRRDQRKMHSLMYPTDITRLVTPGTLTEDRFLQPRRNNFLAAIAPVSMHEGQYALAWLDVSTGVWQYSSPVSPSTLAMHLARVAPSELLIAPALASSPSLQPLLRGLHVTLQEPTAPAIAIALLGEFHSSRSLATPALSTEEHVALASLLHYIQSTHRGRSPSLQAPQRFEVSSTMALDPSARRALELTESYAGDRRASLLAAIDRTLTGPGARLLAARISAPLLSVQDILARQACVSYFVDHRKVADEARAVLRACLDVERALQRLALGKGGPRDLAAIGASLAEAALLRKLLSANAINATSSLPPLLDANTTALGGFEELTSLLASALVTDPPLSSTDGNFIASGFDPTLDSLQMAKSEQATKLSVLQTYYRNKSGVMSLKIRSNNVIGHYVEVSSSSAAKLPSDWRHVQTMAQQMRFHTRELTEIEAAARAAGAGAIERESVLFASLVSTLLEHTDRLRALAAALAEHFVAVIE